MDQEAGKGQQQEVVRQEGVKLQVTKEQEGKGEQQEMVRWQVEETTELGSEAGDIWPNLCDMGPDYGSFSKKKNAALIWTSSKTGLTPPPEF